MFFLVTRILYSCRAGFTTGGESSDGKSVSPVLPSGVMSKSTLLDTRGGHTCMMIHFQLLHL